MIAAFYAHAPTLLAYLKPLPCYVKPLPCIQAFLHLLGIH